MSVLREYLRFRRVQKEARREMWHVFSHHPEVKEEWESRKGLGVKGGDCFWALKILLEWEPDE